jgi:hypothetical protein
MPPKRTLARVAKNPEVPSYKRLPGEVIGLVETGRATAGRVVNRAITTTWWLVGRQIVEHEQRGSSRAGYGEGVITRLSIELTKHFGRGFSPRNLAQMKAFYLWKGILQTVSAKSGVQRFPSLPLPWSHCNRLLAVSDDKSRTFYESEAIRGGWSVRQLDRQISSLAYQRMRGRPGRLKGESSSPDEIVRDPFVLEFLGLKNWTHSDENPPVGLILCSERDAAVAHYALGNLTNKVLAREYQLVLPKARELQARLKKARQSTRASAD